jgi:hypothetical protein
MTYYAQLGARDLVMNIIEDHEERTPAGIWDLIHRGVRLVALPDGVRHPLPGERYEGAVTFVEDHEWLSTDAIPHAEMAVEHHRRVRDVARRALNRIAKVPDAFNWEEEEAQMKLQKSETQLERETRSLVALKERLGRAKTA